VEAGSLRSSDEPLEDEEGAGLRPVRVVQIDMLREIETYVRNTVLNEMGFSSKIILRPNHASQASL
jgi:hypothetical protein